MESTDALPIVGDGHALDAADRVLGDMPNPAWRTRLRDATTKAHLAEIAAEVPPGSTAARAATYLALKFGVWAARGFARELDRRGP